MLCVYVVDECEPVEWTRRRRIDFTVAMCIIYDFRQEPSHNVEAILGNGIWRLVYQDLLWCLLIIMMGSLFNKSVYLRGWLKGLILLWEGNWGINNNLNCDASILR